MSPKHRCVRTREATLEGRPLGKMRWIHGAPQPSDGGRRPQGFDILLDRLHAAESGLIDDELVGSFIEEAGFYLPDDGEFTETADRSSARARATPCV